MIRHFKFAKSEVKYTPRAMNEDEQCSLCRHYYPGRCNIVEGEIKPGGWCNKFEAKSENVK